MATAISVTIQAGTLSATTTPAALSSSTACFEVLLQSDPANTVNVLVGDSSAQPLVLAPGQALTVQVANLAAVYAAAASGTATVNWLARQ